MAKLLKKITTKDVVGKIVGDLFAKVVAGKGAVIPLMQIIGIARKAKPDTSAMGEFVRFIGAFKATNLLTGEVFQSGACILPGAVPDLLYGALSGDGVSEAQFAFNIGVKYDESAIAKYVYTVDSLIEEAATDPLVMLENRVKGIAPALPAPPAAPEAPPAAPDAPPAAPPAAPEAPPAAPATDKKGKGK